MNRFREKWLEEKEQADLDLFERIKDNAKPEIADLWALSESRFIEWRKLHDFPELLNHFDKTLVLFKEWKVDNKLTNEIIIATGKITPFLAHKKVSKSSKNLFLTKQSSGKKEKLFVTDGKIEGVRVQFGQTFKFEFLQQFISYLDWLKERNKYQEILYVNLRSAPNHDSERVWIHANVYANETEFELLKMGGISAPVNGFGILYRGKYIEFANLCGLKFDGNINFGEEGNLHCSYCVCDNWIAEDFSMPLLKLEYCKVINLTLNKSKLQQWLFFDCDVSGDFSNSKLYQVKIYNGNFNPVIRDCTFFETNILVDPNLQDSNFGAYKTFKKIYQSQGDDDIARMYFIKENELVRKELTGWNYLTKSLSYYYWVYGSKPHRIIYLSIAIILIFGVIYWADSNSISANTTNKTFNLGDSIYFSTITFTTLGYGDFSPNGWLKALSAIEAFSGVVNMGFLIAGYSSNKY
ncbi:potassium channel family protein [Mucilaginibacter rubeus]|uniref:Two pore domain potassium channel family protein n=1 Tax=Mucilaginibacter rubeus TaxID=2027860 RepID=A0A5C1HXA6_9SPHI|nr:potassium channel family protein [Mucilaginibacter rubeus]QEM10183.1 two pore domain potassium channel family protein [Mucilaginibacter rubeus]